MPCRHCSGMTRLAAKSTCVSLLLILAACSGKENVDASASAAPVSTDVEAKAPPVAPSSETPTFAGVEQALNSGAYDSAAAQLLDMRVRGKNFTESEAAEYRRLLNDVYLKALDPAQKGDLRAKAAIEMIRANPGR